MYIRYARGHCSRRAVRVACQLMHPRAWLAALALPLAIVACGGATTSGSATTAPPTTKPAGVTVAQVASVIAKNSKAISDQAAVMRLRACSTIATAVCRANYRPMTSRLLDFGNDFLPLKEKGIPAEVANLYNDTFDAMDDLVGPLRTYITDCDVDGLDPVTVPACQEVNKAMHAALSAFERQLAAWAPYL
jgi:hypothetical protein